MGLKQPKWQTITRRQMLAEFNQAAGDPQCSWQPFVWWAKWLLWSGLSGYKGLASFIKCSFKMEGSSVLGSAIYQKQNGFCTCRILLGRKYRNLWFFFSSNLLKKEHFSADTIYLVISVSLRHNVLGASSFPLCYRIAFSYF